MFMDVMHHGHHGRHGRERKTYVRDVPAMHMAIQAESMTPDCVCVQRARHQRVDHVCYAFPMWEGCVLLTPPFGWCFHTEFLLKTLTTRKHSSSAAERESVRSISVDAERFRCSEVFFPVETFNVRARHISVLTTWRCRPRLWTCPPGTCRSKPRRHDAVHVRCVVDKRMPGTVSHSDTTPLATRWLISSCIAQGNWRTFALAFKVSWCNLRVVGAGSGLECIA